MYRVLNESTDEIIHEGTEYDNAVTIMRKLNDGRDRVFLARGWAKTSKGNIERELYQIGDNRIYGSYIIVDN